MGVVRIIKKDGQIIMPDRPQKEFDQLVEVGPGDQIDYYISKRIPKRDGTMPSTINNPSVDVAEMQNRTNALRES